MKKKIYFLLLTVMLIPFAVKAEIDLEAIQEDISKDNQITIKSIPLDYYRETKFYDDCLSRFDENYSGDPNEACILEVYRDIVSSHIKRNVEIPNKVHMWVTGCDIDAATCKVSLYLGQESSMEDYKINFVEVENEKDSNQAEKVLSKMKNNYKLEDMGYINQLINFKGIKGFFDELQSSSKIFKMYPEMKVYIEQNPNIEYVSVFGGGGGTPTSYGAGGNIIAYSNDIAIGITSIGYYTNRLVYISDTTEKTKEAYIEAAIKRIKEYINDDNYEIKIEFDEQMTTDLCNDEVKECIFTDVFKKGDKYNMELYQMTINGDKQTLGIMPVPEKELKKIDVKSKDYKTGVNIETNSSDVPLDTSVDSKDVTEKHKDFIKAYDINLFSDLKNEYIKEVKDGIIVRIPLEDDFDKKIVDVYHVKEDGTKGQKYEGKIEKIDGKKYAVFTTNHFSTYAIAEQKENKVTEKVPNTNDTIGKSITILLFSIIGILSTIIYIKKATN